MEAGTGKLIIGRARRVHGHRPQENLRTFAGSSVSLEGMIAARKESDVGMRVLALLLGADFELITFIDGYVP